MNATMEEIVLLVRLQLGKRTVLATDHLYNDLGAESIDIVNLVATLEEQFDVTIDEEQLGAIQIVSDLYELVWG